MDFEFFQRPHDTRLSPALLESRDASVFGVDLEGRCTYVNTAGAALLRATPSDLLGVDLHRLIHVAPTGRAEHASDECSIVRCAATQTTVIVNDELLWRPDQTNFASDLIASPILEHDVVTGTLVVLRDTTPQPLGVETARREGEAYFRVMADTAPVLIWVSGQDKACTYFNRGWLEFRGRTLEQEFGHGWVEGVHPEDAERVIATYSEAFDKRHPYRLEYRLMRSDGAYRWILVSGTPRYTDNGAFAGYVGSCVDITERRTTEMERDRLLVAERAAREQAETAIQQRDELLALVSHDLRSPVGTIRVWAQLLQRRATRGLSGEQDRDRLLDGLRQIEGSTGRMVMLIDELLDVAQMEAGQQLELDQQPTDLVALARLAAAEHQANSDRHQIQVQAGQPQVTGIWDAPRLRRVLDNLLSNAVKYSPAGGEIVVSVDLDTEGSGALLKVRDHGVGVPADETSRIFERFFRASNAPGRIAGFGIGLAGVRQIVEQHGGTITVESKEGQGSVFTLRLPLNPENCAGQANTAEVLPGPGG